MKLDILTLREIWRARSGREKTLLTTLGALLGIALLYGLLWRPAATHRARLSAEIWALQSELAQMKQQEQEARRLARASSSATPFGRSADRRASSIACSLWTRQGKNSERARRRAYPAQRCAIFKLGGLA